MIYGSVCSGIEAATVAWHPLGWKPAFFSEIEKFPRAVLAYHYPDVPCHGDFTTIKSGEYDAINLLVGGTPCQDFSVAGLRKGISGERGNLTLEFVRLAERLKPRFLVWENVPGVLSIDGGRAFGAFLGGMAECGYGFSYRILDAEYFGVPQRRRRVFVVGHLGDWRPAAAVLFERESLRWDITPRRETGEEVAGTIGARTCRSIGAQDADLEHLFSCPKISPALKARDCKGPSSDGDGDGAPLITYPINTQIAMRHEALGEGTGMGIGTNSDPAFTLQAGHSHAVCYGLDEEQNAHENLMGCLKSREKGGGFEGAVAFAQNQTGEIREGEVFNTLNQNSNASGRNTPLLKSGMSVRRLTPTECERLQGFPDGYTKINAKTADGPRYKALGNSMAVPVMAWIGQRIETVLASEAP
jgi:DNA (cytosine-5)-methyltransferase 1